MKPKRDGMRRLSIALPDQYYEMVSAEADKQGRSFARQIEIIVGEWLTQRSQPKKERTQK